VEGLGANEQAVLREGLGFRGQRAGSAVLVEGLGAKEQAVFSEVLGFTGQRTGCTQGGFRGLYR
jgi:hypothetical protein